MFRSSEIGYILAYFFLTKYHAQTRCIASVHGRVAFTTNRPVRAHLLSQLFYPEPAFHAENPAFIMHT
jgi:hypothetical protein